MFTGLIQAKGRVKRSSSGLLVDGCSPFSPLGLGDSVAVDGVCLTVSEVVQDGFLADVSEETLSRTTLALKAERGEIVNLEPALRFNDRLGGHLVSGHVDGLGEVIGIDKLIHSWELEILWRDDSHFSRFICEKGSIALNGISLTVTRFEEEGTRFWIAVIPHTWVNTSLETLSLGALVNLEVDLLAKYSERLLEANTHFRAGNQVQKNAKDISLDWLEKHGWT